MNLAERLPDPLKSVSTARMIFTLWFAGAAILGALLLLVTLQRLGLNPSIAHPVALVFFVVGVLAASWAGRTVNAPLFFFAGRSSNSGALGVGGAFVWAGGAFILLFFALASQERMLMSIATLLGIALHGLVFAGPMRASRVASSPGALAWRHGARETALAILPVCLVVMTLMALAEQAIATQFFALLSGVGEGSSAWIVAALAILPALLGGWMALMIVNAVLGVWILIALLGPATIVGFAGGLLERVAGAIDAGHVLPLLIPPDSTLLTRQDAIALPLALIVIATGLASLPQALARASLASHRPAAIESAAWSALTIFLILSAFGLSIGLIVQTPEPSAQGALLRQQIALNLLPYAAILFAAFNGLSISIWVFVSTLVRTLRRGRVAEPGGGSMFTTRVLLLASTVPLAAWPDLTGLDTSRLFLSAIALSSAGLFVPLMASFWLLRADKITVIASTVAGGATTGLLLTLGTISPDIWPWLWMDVTAPVPAGGIGLAISAGIVAGGVLVRPTSGTVQEDALARIGTPGET